MTHIYLERLKDILSADGPADDSKLPDYLPFGRTGTSKGMAPYPIQHLLVYYKELEDELKEGPSKDGLLEHALGTTHNILQIAFKQFLKLGDSGEVILVKGWNMFVLTPLSIPSTNPYSTQVRGRNLN